MSLLPLKNASSNVDSRRVAFSISYISNIMTRYSSLIAKPCDHPGHFVGSASNPVGDWCKQGMLSRRLSVCLSTDILFQRSTDRCLNKLPTGLTYRVERMHHDRISGQTGIVIKACALNRHGDFGRIRRRYISSNHGVTDDLQELLQAHGTSRAIIYSLATCSSSRTGSAIALTVFTSTITHSICALRSEQRR